jgi:hypothetical protein
MCRRAERRVLYITTQKKAAKGFSLLSIIGSLSASPHSPTSVAILLTHRRSCAYQQNAVWVPTASSEQMKAQTSALSRPACW